MIAAPLIFLLSPVLTVERPAVALPVLLKEIGPTLGVELKSDPSLSEKRVVVRFKDAPRERVMAALESAFEASWVEDRGAFLLRPLPDAAQARLEVRKRQIASAVKETLEAPGPLNEWGPADADAVAREQLDWQERLRESRDYQGYQESGRRTAEGRLFRRVLAILPVDVVSRVATGQRAVFVANPNRIQHALPSGFAAAARAYVNEAKLQRAALARTGAPEYEGLPEPVFTEARSLIVVSNTSGYLTIRVSIGGRGGSRSPEVTESLQVGPRWTPEPPKGAPEPPGELVPGAEADLFVRLVKARFPGNAGTPLVLSEEDRKRGTELFSDLVANEPLAWAVSDTLIQSARSLGRELVAVVPDGATFAVYSSALADKATLRDGLSSLTRVVGMPDESVEGLWVFRGQPEIAGFDFTLSRRAVSRYVALASKGGATLEAEAELALGSARPGDYAIDRAFASLALAASPNVPSMDGSEWRALRIFGLLAPNQRHLVAGDGLRLTFGQCPASIRAELTAMVFQAEATFTAQPIGDGGEYSGSAGDGGETEPTTLFPNALPADAQLLVTLTSKPSLFVRRIHPGGYSMIDATRADQEGSMIAWREADPGGWEFQSSYATSTLVRLSVAFTVRPGMVLNARFTLPPQIPTDGFVPLDKLPDEIRSEIDKAAAETRKHTQRMPNERPRSKP